MKKILVRVGAAIGALLIVAVLGLVVKFYLLSPKLRPAPEVKAPSSPEAIAHGKYLVDHVTGCLGCHSQVREDEPGEPAVETMLGSGRDFGEIAGLGHMRAPNISSDPERGIGRWSDGEVLRAIREGVSRDGRPLFPQMPYLTYGAALSDDDALAIIAYLRTLKPVASNPGPFEVNFPISMFVRAAPKPIDASPPPAPPPTDRLARGRWLLKVASCNDCHDSVDARHQKLPGGELAGGAEFPLPQGKGTAVAPNITSDKATGIGAYSDDDVLRVFDEGKGKSGRVLYVMPWRYYGGMTRDDKLALVAALREAKPVANLVRPSEIR